MAASAFSAGCLLGAAPALAATPDAAPAAGADTTTTELVVVAEKTSERIVDVPINVTSVSGNQIREAHATQATDLMTLVPNVDVKQNIPGAQAIVTVRGVGLDDFSSTNNSSVGVYVDDVFLASFAEMDFHFYDLDHLEVLKGPQGTLYGRNSTAGAINILSAKPSTASFDGRITAGYGNYDDFEADGFVNVPVSDTLALRFSAMTDQQGQGYWFSRVLDAHMGRQDNNLGRFQALWTPDGKTSVLLKIEGEYDRSGIGVGKFFGTVPVAGYTGTCPNFAAPANCTDYHNYTDTTPNPFQGDWNHPAPYNVDQLNTTLHVNSDLGWAKLSSITGYITFRREFYTDADASPTQQAEFDQHDNVSQFSQELRLNGDVQKLQWMVGGYYSWDRVHSFTPGVVDVNFDGLPDPNSAFVGADVFIHSLQTTTSEALYGRLKYDLTDQWAVEGGLRFTNEDRSYVGGTEDVTPQPAFSLCDVLVACTTTPANLTFLSASIHDANISWRGAVDWKPARDTLVYVSVSRGEKSGGFFNGITTSDAALAPYKPEVLTDYEGGFNSLLFDRRLQVESSVFYYDYQDLQAQTFTQVGAIGLIKLGNIPHATVYGADFNLTVRPVEGLTLRAGVGLLHTWLGAFQTTFPVPAGNKLPDAPSVTFNGSARYEHALGDHFVGAIELSPRYSGAEFKEALNTPYLSSGAYWILDARASIATTDGAWELAVWGRNVTNTLYVAQATNDALGMGYRVFNAPATYGFTVSRKF